MNYKLIFKVMGTLGFIALNFNYFWQMQFLNPMPGGEQELVAKVLVRVLIILTVVLHGVLCVGLYYGMVWVFENLNKNKEEAEEAR